MRGECVPLFRTGCTPLARCAARGPERRAGQIGSSSSKKNLVPHPMRDSTFSSDFIALASLRQMVSPRPVCENNCARRPDSLRSGWKANRVRT